MRFHPIAQVVRIASPIASLRPGVSLLLPIFFCLIVGIFGFSSIRAAADQQRSPRSSDPVAEVDFGNQVRPILARRCFACHGPDLVEAGLSFTDRESAMAETDSGDFAILPGDPEASGLIARVTSEFEGERMPPEGDPLSAAEIDILRRWIAAGAPWDRHWGFEPLSDPTPPQVSDPDWAANPVDAFVFASLAAERLKPNPPADRRTLIRRAHYDLTGLPPSPEQVAAFVADPDPQAFEKLIDRLLDSPHYGERWGRHWLDLVRYAETNSFERDGPKPNAWKYRDYVIRSLNEDKPYSRFVREQLAGDELDDVTTDSLIATGYYRLGIWDDEPADPLQSRFDEMDDIISTTGQVFLGLTIDCARCHDHKIDPIPQADYYSMLAFLADVKPYGTRGNQTENNQLDVSSDELKRRYADNDRRRGEVEAAMREIEQAGIAKMSAEDQRATEGERRAREQVLDQHLESHLDREQWARYGELKARRDEIAAEFRALPPRERVLALAVCDPEPEPTFVLFRGNPHSPTDRVDPAFPTLFGDAPPKLPEPGPSATSAGRRRILADWIVSPDNRLTWRVIANRVWQHHFGRGIVRSTNNFGQLGTPPTHPELLDFLARQLLATDGRLKPLHRLIMTSQAYQMSSAADERGLAVDPGNDLFWRYDSRRLSAEEVRDSILAVNGSLNRDLFGPSVYPDLSAEVLAGQSQPGKGWGKSNEHQAARRSIYVHVKRSLLLPLLAAFDLPEPDRSCEARFSTLQPGQALALLNGDFIHQQAGRLAESVGAAELDDEAVAGSVIRAVLARDASSSEVAAAVELMTDLRDTHELSRSESIDLFCLTVLNWNEFVFVD